VTTLEKRYDSFSESYFYDNFQLTFARIIGKEVFRLSLCSCVRDPSPESCADLIYSRLREYMKALHDSLSYNPAVKGRMDKCQCTRHRQAREQDAATFGESDGSALMWEEHLNARSVDSIKLTCCPAVEEPTLRKDNNDNEPAPRMVPWKCGHLTSCEDSPQYLDCGIEEKLGVLVSVQH
jgi:hypothetical protein